MPGKCRHPIGFCELRHRTPQSLPLHFQRSPLYLATVQIQLKDIATRRTERLGVPVKDELIARCVKAESALPPCATLRRVQYCNPGGISSRVIQIHRELTGTWATDTIHSTVVLPVRGQPTYLRSSSLRNCQCCLATSILQIRSCPDRTLRSMSYLRPLRAGTRTR